MGVATGEEAKLRALRRYDGRPLVLVLVGTESRAAHILVEWIERWPARSMAEIVLQHGAASPLAGTECHEFLSAGHRQDLIAVADAVVCTGEPAIVTDAVRLGQRPIVVPCVVDSGDVAARRLETFTSVVRTDETLYLELDRLFIDLTAHRAEPAERAVAERTPHHDHPSGA